MKGKSSTKDSVKQDNNDCGEEEGSSITDDDSASNRDVPPNEDCQVHHDVLAMTRLGLSTRTSPTPTIRLQPQSTTVMAHTATDRNWLPTPTRRLRFQPTI